MKRFDYDWERETPIKFNDYFEFPRELDMEPYTVQGLAKAEGMSVIDETTDEDLSTITRYKLVGIIVHSGQANGGHYYSFVQQKFVLSIEKKKKKFPFCLFVTETKLWQQLNFLNGTNSMIQM